MERGRIRKIWDRIKMTGSNVFKNMRLGRNALWLIFVISFGVLMFLLLTVVLGPFGPMSRFPAAFLLIYIGVATLMFLDKVYFHKINTLKAIEQHNVSYAIVILSYAIIIAAVLSSV